MSLLGLDLRKFVKEVVAGLGGGFVSEVLVQRLPEGIARVLGRWATPVVGFGIGLLGNYLKDKIDRDIADIIEMAGAVTVGNWIWEMVKTQFGGTKAGTEVVGTAQEIIYVPPVPAEEKRKLEEEEEFATVI